jgi:phenylpropionate dioxygenase-like ring-hydroxylating dioxygenase large terminal subunit
VAHASEVDELLGRVAREMTDGLLPARVFADPDLYRAELRRIFTRAWVFIGFEAELPRPGDYSLRRIGEDSFIFVRDDAGRLRVLFNACRHRGTQLCRTDWGNAANFTCPYHGWSYENSGALTAVPAQDMGYRGLDLSDWGLHEAAQIDSYNGMVFACLDPSAPALEDYLGDVRWYLDIQFRLTSQGMAVLGEPHRWIVDANWKQGAENFCGDSSHTQMTHRSVLDAGYIPSEAGAAHGLQVHDCDGHAVSMRQRKDGVSVFWEYPEEVTRHFDAKRLGADQFDLARGGMAHLGTVFPNFSFLHVGLTNSREQDAGGYLSVRVWQPMGPTRMEIWNWILAPREASDAYKRRAYQLGTNSFSPSGTFEQDDVAIWPGVARNASSVFAEMNDMTFNYQMGLGERFNVEPIEDWPGPGRAVPSNAGEGGLRTFHQSWLRMMTADTP